MQNDRFRISRDEKIRLLKLVNVLLMTVAFGMAWFLYLVPFQSGRTTLIYENLIILLIYAFVYSGCCRTYDAFLISYLPVSELAFSQALSLIVTNFLMMLITWLVISRLPNMVVFLCLFLIQILISILWLKSVNGWYYRKYHAKKTFVVWETRKEMEHLINAYGLNTEFDVVGNCSATECVNNLSVLNSIQTVFLSGVHSHNRNVIMKYCVDKGITCFILPRIGDVILSGAHRMHMFHLPVLRVGRYNPSPAFRFVKRFFDIVLSLAALVILSPVMIVTTVLVKKDGGPAIYKQTRLTTNGKEFSLYKFRSMYVDAEKDGVARLSSGDDDERITSVGKAIRHCRIDELPQLINILKGDMSIVGPRPERPEIATQYEKEIPEFRLRLQAKSGLTGYAQVYGKYNTNPYDKLQMDLMYISHPSVLQDISIIFATLKILFMKESTEGVGKGKTTA